MVRRDTLAEDFVVRDAGLGVADKSLINGFGAENEVPSNGTLKAIPWSQSAIACRARIVWVNFTGI